MKMIFYIFMIYCVALIACVPVADDTKTYCNYSGLQIKIGETVAAPVGECGTLQCQDPEKDTVVGVGCGTFDIIVRIPGPKCKIVPGDQDKQYPDCCEQVKCDGYYEPVQYTLKNSTDGDTLSSV